MIYTFNSDPGTVSAINGLTNVVTQTVPVGDGVSGITADPNTDEVYLGNQSTGTVMPLSSILDNRTYVAVGRSPFGVATNTITNMIYNSNQESNTISVINGSTNEVVQTIPVGLGPLDVAINADTNFDLQLQLLF